MSKAVLISIQPKWCELIASGRKTIEVRRTRPSIETPFKCYIYCTKGRDLLRAVNVAIIKRNGTHESRTTCKIYNESYVTNKVLNGKVIGELVCDRIKTIKNYTVDMGGKEHYLLCGGALQGTCLTGKEIYDYGKGTTLYGWHISDLVIYDKPRELGEFIASTPKSKFRAHDDKLTRPPQSWCYVNGNIRRT